MTKKDVLLIDNSDLVKSAECSTVKGVTLLDISHSLLPYNQAAIVIFIDLYGGVSILKNRYGNTIILPAI